MRAAARQCHGCRRSLPDWWPEPGCPGCATPAPAVVEPAAVPVAAVPPPPPPAWISTPALSGRLGAAASSRAGRWAAAALRLAARRVVARLAIGAIVMTAGGVAAMAGDSKQNALDSPARAVLLQPCAQYRSFLGRNDAGAQFVTWVANNQAAFEEAARLDPTLSEASASMHALQAYLTTRRTGGPQLSEAERHALDDAMVESCLRGPGRA